MKLGKTGKRGIILLAVLVVVVFIARGFTSKPKAAVAEQKYIPVQVEVASKKTLVNTATLSGKISSDTDVSVIPKVSGKVLSVAVKVGDSVSKGAVLFSLDPSDIQKQVDNANATLQLANASYQKSKEQWDTGKASLERTKAVAADKIANAQKDLANTKALYEAGAVAKVQLDQAEVGLKELESTYANQIEQLEIQASDSTLQLAQAQLNQAKVGYNQALDALNNAEVTAPVDGVVSQVNVTVGNMASTAQAGVSLTDISNVYSTLSVAENIVNHLAKDKPVKVTVASVSEKSFSGKIDNISPSADPKTQLYPIKISMQNPDGLIKPGMFAKAELTTEEKPDVLAVKSEAVVLKNGKTIVYLVQGDKAVPKEVATGLDTGVEIEILKGLNINDKVIVKGQTLVDEGSTVKIVGGEAS
ncbi:MAG: efflux RND transporter periplasmic adaptor subunit [Bacillota bacterium]|nr:efflux RND transporter periplasmic adaptor subunit [Bacillota bacterium]